MPICTLATRIDIFQCFFVVPRKFFLPARTHVYRVRPSPRPVLFSQNYTRLGSAAWCVCPAPPVRDVTIPIPPIPIPIPIPITEYRIGIVTSLPFVPVLVLKTRHLYARRHVSRATKFVDHTPLVGIVNSILLKTILCIRSSNLNEILGSIKLKGLCLLAKDYQMLNESILLLTLFSEATTLTQSESTSSISRIAPTVLAFYYDLLCEQSNILYTMSLCNSLLISLLSQFVGLLEELGVIIDKSVQQRFIRTLF